MNNKYVNDFTEATEAYINELNDPNYEIIPKEIEDDLIAKMKDGDTHAYKQLLNAHLRLVIKIAKKYKGLNVEMPELISEGNMGLITALDRFDPEKGVRLCSYAIFWIRKNILAIINERNDFNNRETSFSNIIDESDNKKILEITYQDDPIDEDYEEDETNKIISTLLDSLDDRSKFIIEHFYGLNDKEELTVREISEKLSISTERVRQLKTKAMMELRSQALVNNFTMAM